MSEVDRRAPIHYLKIDVTVSSNELFRDGLMSSLGREVEREILLKIVTVIIKEPLYRKFLFLVCFVSSSTD